MALGAVGWKVALEAGFILPGESTRFGEWGERVERLGFKRHQVPFGQELLRFCGIV